MCKLCFARYGTSRARTLYSTSTYEHCDARIRPDVVLQCNQSINRPNEFHSKKILWIHRIIRVFIQILFDSTNLSHHLTLNAQKSAENNHDSAEKKETKETFLLPNMDAIQKRSINLDTGWTQETERPIKTGEYGCRQSRQDPCHERKKEKLFDAHKKQSMIRKKFVSGRIIRYGNSYQDVSYDTEIRIRTQSKKWAKNVSPFFPHKKIEKRGSCLNVLWRSAQQTLHTLDNFLRLFMATLPALLTVEYDVLVVIVNLHQFHFGGGHFRTLCVLLIHHQSAQRSARHGGRLAPGHGNGHGHVIGIAVGDENDMMRQLGLFDRGGRGAELGFRFQFQREIGLGGSRPFVVHGNGSKMTLLEGFAGRADWRFRLDRWSFVFIARLQELHDFLLGRRRRANLQNQKVLKRFFSKQPYNTASYSRASHFLKSVPWERNISIRFILQISPSKDIKWCGKWGAKRHVAYVLNVITLCPRHFTFLPREISL